MAFNFGQAAGGGGGGFNFGAPKTTAAASATAAAFGFQSSSAPAGGGFSFGTPVQPQPQAGTATPQLTGLLTQPTPGSSAGGFSFSTPAQNSTPSGGFAFGAAPKMGLTSDSLSLTATSQPAPTGVTLGGLVSSSASATSGFTLGGISAQTTAPVQPQGGFSFGAPKVPAAVPTPAQLTPALSLGGQTTGLTLGAAPPASAAPVAAAAAAAGGGGFSFGINPAATPAPATTTPAIQSTSATGSSLFVNPIASTSATGFTLGAPATSGAPAAPTAAPVSTGLTLKPLGAATTSAGAIGTATSVPATGFTLGLKPAASTVATTIASAISTAVAPTSTAPVMTYSQLEGLINKWSSELEDQERHFLQQATQVNAWDRMLVENGEKITSLHKDMEKVKLDQRRLDQELDFILSQQKELEDLLDPLEEMVKEQSGTIYMQNADEERERTYKLAESVDAQLKRMSQDLKEIIEHLNTSSGPSDTADPLQQICKILNAHMDSLQWVEQNSVLLQRRVEEVSKLCESRSKEQEKSFRLNFQ
ncbi:nucleoporin 62 like [Denticeps clupeoides]|uniref:Nuclear pore glycoprotein p62 n=1 Tax=Denticeps clupeoides TaxID=299321 RepID=A0AAY4DVW9_9TELE|nr:nuclear pore glycoprotein p62 [Denticeps clupeoides]